MARAELSPVKSNQSKSPAGKQASLRRRPTGLAVESIFCPEDVADPFDTVEWDQRTAAIKGVVQGLGAGVLDTDRVNLPRSVPYVQRSLNWVIVAQRFPVRVRLVDPPQNLVRLGATAVIEMKHGASCR